MSVADHTWDKWKTLYRTAAKKSAIKAKVTGGKDLFGSANAATGSTDGTMQTARKECDGIPEYIHTLEDAQAKAAQAKVPITDTMLRIIANSAMLQTEQYPRANDEWEDMPVADHTWDKWKLLYWTAAKKAAIKAKATGGKELFRSANAATVSTDESEDMNPPMGANLEGYFDNIAAAAMNEKKMP